MNGLYLNLFQRLSEMIEESQKHPATKLRVVSKINHFINFGYSGFKTAVDFSGPKLLPLSFWVNCHNTNLFECLFQNRDEREIVMRVIIG